MEGHRITFRSFWKSFFTLPQHLTGACFSIACESCFTRACVRSSSIATHRIGATAVRVGRTLVDICVRTSKLHRVLESVILYRSDSSYPVDKIVHLLLLLSLFIYIFLRNLIIFTHPTCTNDMTVLGLCLLFNYYRRTSLSDHPKCEHLVVAYENRTRGGISHYSGPKTSIFVLKIIYFTEFTIFVIPSPLMGRGVV